MTQTLPSYEQYTADHSAFEGDVAGRSPKWLTKVRRQALASFDAVGFPTATRGNERWKYTNVGPLARATFGYPFGKASKAVSLSAIKRRAPWDDGWTSLVFVDGRYSSALSSSPPASGGLRVSSLADAVQQGGSLVDQHLGRHAAVDGNGFTAINTALVHDGAFVQVPQDGAPPAPLHVIFITTERPEPIVSYPRTLIVAGPRSSMTVVESYVGLSQGPYFTNAVVEIVADEGAQIEHYRYLSESANAYHVGNTQVTLGRDSSFNSTSFATGAKLARNELHVLLDAPGGSCNLSGLYSTSGSEHIDNHIDIDHAQPHTSSDQYFKGILADSSRAVFSGRVLIRKDAQKTFARQADKNLLLSEGARVNTKPSLEIFADDVQATHGATAGAVAQDALFYMMSRGLDEETARRALVYAFASEIIERVSLKPLRRYLDRKFSNPKA